MPAQELDPRKVRIGLGMVAVAVVVALVLIAVVDSPLARAIMGVIVVLGIVRGVLLYRSIQRQETGTETG